jgi:transketolase
MLPITPGTTASLAAIARCLRRHVIGMTWRAQAGHPGGSLSTAEILACLYFQVMRIDPAQPQWPERDRFILSKGHAAPILYAALAERGYFSLTTLDTYDCLDSLLQGHPDMRTPGVDIPAGSLGQGLSAGVGLALGSRMRGYGFRVYVLLGDGELQEGQIWEAAMSAAHFHLHNLTAIIDYNQLQLYDLVTRTLDIRPLADKWQAFGWQVLEVNGHDIPALLAAFSAVQEITGQPAVIIAHTTKGKGVSFMEDNPAWHSRSPNEAEYRQALAELGETEDEP